MNLSFSAVITDNEIECSIGSAVDLRAPVFCFSLMAAARAVSGCTLVRAVAGYAEMQLPDIKAGHSHQFRIAHVDPRYRVANRAWLPLGGYLRLRDGSTQPLPLLPQGVISGPEVAEPGFDGLRLIPQPTVWTPAPGVLLATRFAGQGDPLEQVAALAVRCNFGPFLSPDGAALAVCHDAAMAEEAYSLTIDPTGVTVTAAGRAGLFYGGITLLNLIITYDGAIPCGQMTDAPRFGWRGQHLDCARHFFETGTLHRLLDLMALFKLNRFHWHFADDESFRLQVDCAPALWQKTAFRGEGLPIPGVFGGGIRAGGSYSKADVADLLAHAKALNIEILPEIEVPAHGYAINSAVMGLRDPGDNGSEVSVQGYPINVINPAVAATWELLEPLMVEVAALFPIGILHLGCDELPPDAWAGSPLVTALKAREGLETRDDVQGWMMEKLAASLAARGIRPAAWEEAAKGNNGGIGHNALLFSWTGQGPGVEAARAGYDVVMCPAQKVYFDMAHSDDPDDWGARWAGFIPLDQVVNWDPIPKGAADIAPRVIGIQGTFWGEFTTADAQMEALLAPRILGLATKAWDHNDSVTGPKLRSLAAAYGRVFDIMGWDRRV
jgi:hexosaminidase